MTASNEIRLNERIADNLATRRAADELFDFVEASPNKTIILNFKSIVFVSRSFAHEYILKKGEASKKVIEKNMSTPVRKMFKMVNSEKRASLTSNPLQLQSFSLTAKNL